MCHYTGLSVGFSRIQNQYLIPVLNSNICHTTCVIIGRRYICWLLVVTFCYSYNAWCIALRSTFTLYQTPENTVYWMIADYLCDIVYLVDVALVKPRLTYLHEGFWITDTHDTRKHYRGKLQYKVEYLQITYDNIF